MKKTRAFLSSVILGPILGCLLSNFWAEGGNTFWKPIDYFPLPVERIIAIEPFGYEFWVEANDHAIYHVVFPCEKEQTCWNKTNIIPEITKFIGDYKVSDRKCENVDFVYPLFRKIKTCITARVLTPDAYWNVSLVLTEDDELWIWQKPWVDPFTILTNLLFSIFVGAIIGLALGVFLAWKIR